MNKIVQKIGIGITTAALMAVSFVIPAVAASNTNYTVTPYTYVGAAGDCGPGYPAGTPGGVVARWDNTIGNPAPSLLLAKNVPITDCSAAGATINGVSGITLTELNYDVSGYCNAGAPRFNVVTTDGITHFFGCLQGTHTPTGNGFTHVVFTPAQGLPAVTPGESVQSIEIVQDETGTTHLDNISINNQIIGGPTADEQKESCKKGGYQTMTDSQGNSFKNQGQCVSYFEHQSH